MKLMQRFGADMPDEQIDECLDMFLKNPGSCDEIWIATKYGYPSNQIHKEYAEYWVEKAKKFRENGIGVSMQISNTLGHGSYMRARDCSGLVFDGSPARRLVGHDGSVAEYCFCWNDAYFRAYLCEHLAYYAKIKPDRIWFDDDFRPTNHSPVSYGCFCDSCMARFNELYSASFTREELVNEFLHGDKLWRERYIKFVTDGMADMMRDMCRVIHSVSPSTEFGYQHGVYGAFYGDYTPIYDVMREVSGTAPASRPGGGAYNDHNPNDFLNKALMINWQNAFLPGYVKLKAPEIENLPFAAFGKTAAGTAFETSHYMACGNTDMSYSMMMRMHEPPEFYEEFLKLFSSQRGYWEKLSEYNKVSSAAGLRYYFSKEIRKKDIAPHEGMNDFNYMPFWAPADLIRTGIPISYDTFDSDVILLHPESAKTLQSEDVEYLKGKNVVTDAETIEILQSKGWDFGIETVKITADEALVMSERFTSHLLAPVNNEYTTSFFTSGRSVAHSMKINAPSVEILAYYAPKQKIDEYFPNTDMPYGVSEAVITTDKGAKWAVLGYFMWKNVIPSYMRDHILDIAEYISSKPLSARPVDAIPAVINPRINSDGKTVCVSITNCSIGKMKETELLIRNPVCTEFYFMSQYNTSRKLEFVKKGDSYAVKLPGLDAWSVGTVFCINQ